MKPRTVISFMFGWLLTDIVRGKMNPFTPVVIVAFVVYIVFLVIKKIRDQRAVPHVD